MVLDRSPESLLAMAAILFHGSNQCEKYRGQASNNCEIGTSSNFEDMLFRDFSP